MGQFEVLLPKLLGFARPSGAKTQNETQRYLAGEQNSQLNPTYKRIVELEISYLETINYLLFKWCGISARHSNKPVANCRLMDDALESFAICSNTSLAS